MREIKLRNRGSSSASLARRRKIASFPDDLMERLEVELLGDEVELLGDEVELLGDEVELLGDEVELLGDEVEFLRWDRKSEILAWQERAGKDRTYFLWFDKIAAGTTPATVVRPKSFSMDFNESGRGTGVEASGV
jgi:hypothetical protein